jgi:hypothetical protein
MQLFPKATFREPPLQQFLRESRGGMRGGYSLVERHGAQQVASRSLATSRVTSVVTVGVEHRAEK